MLILSLSFLNILGSNKIYTVFVPWKFVQNYCEFYLTLYIDHCPLLTFLLVGFISTLWIILGLYKYSWCITSFKSSPGNKERHMFYLANVIIFSVVLELLWKSTLLVRYKLNILRYLRVNQFDIRALFFSGYAMFIMLDKIVYIYNGNLSSVSSLMSQLALILFPLCIGLLL